MERGSPLGSRGYEAETARTKLKQPSLHLMRPRGGSALGEARARRRTSEDAVASVSGAAGPASRKPIFAATCATMADTIGSSVGAASAVWLFAMRRRVALCIPARTSSPSQAAKCTPTQELHGRGAQVAAEVQGVVADNGARLHAGAAQPLRERSHFTHNGGGEENLGRGARDVALHQDHGGEPVKAQVGETNPPQGDGQIDVGHRHGGRVRQADQADVT